MSLLDVERMLKGQAVPRGEGIPYDVARRIDETLQALPDRQVIRKKARIRKGSYAAASVLVLAGGVGAFAAFAGPEAKSEIRNVPVIGALLPKAHDEGLYQATDQGITIRIDNIVYDGYALKVDYAIASDKPVSATDLDVDLKIDGLPVNGVVHNKDGGSYPRVYERGTHPGEAEGVLETGMSMYRPNSFRMGLEVTRVGDAKGRWPFDVPVNKTSDITVLEPGIAKSNSVYALEVRSVTLTPLTTAIRTAASLRDRSMKAYVGFDVVTDSGDVAGIGRYYLDGTAMQQVQTMDFQALRGRTRFITLRPYQFLEDASSETFRETSRVVMEEPPTEEHPIILTQGDAGRVLVTRVEYFEDRIVVRYRTEGNNPFEQAQQFYVEDGKGNRANVLSQTPFNIHHPEQVIELSPLPSDAKLTFVTRSVVPLTYYPDMQIRVKLPD